MVGLKFDAAKRGFFDRHAVMDALGRARAKVLSKFGAYVWKRAKTSLRYREASSAPGSPPSAHKTISREKRSRETGQVKRQLVSPLREFIFFSYDRDRESVVIGPALLGGHAGAAALAALEYGGQTTVLERVPGSGPNARTTRRQKRVTIAARPFMGPAFEAELPQLPQMWRDSVK